MRTKSNEMGTRRKPPAEAKASRVATSSIVGAWSSGYMEGMPEGHKAIARGGYGIGLHEGMRYMVGLIYEGVEVREAARRCMGRVSDPDRRAYWERLIARLDAGQGFEEPKQSEPEQSTAQDGHASAD